MTSNLLSLLLACAMLAAGPAFGQVRDKPVAAGEMAPDFTLTDHNGEKRSLSAERGKRPVVLVFYRGYW
jgi:cytochrome oxidase Cu insertion factor (SCO1/SenC/PrrC family)